jgi:hypothetical protein
MAPSLTYLCGLAAAVYVTTSLGEAIEAAGFGSRPSYYAVKAKLKTS